MNSQAVEMLNVLSHRDVIPCLDEIDRLDMVNIKIEKLVARCPGCTTYIITGNPKVGGDVVLPEKASVSIIGKGVRSTYGFGFSQRYTCKIKN